MDILSEVALSMMGSRTTREYLRSETDPAAFFVSCDERQTAGHIVKKYGPDPLVAAERIICRCEDDGVAIIPFRDDRYPLLLREIADPPLILYCKGTIPDQPMVSIVGTRRSDRSDDEITRLLARDFTRAGLCVVSGMAIGIDRAAHIGACESGSTVAVLPHGIDIRSPVTNLDLYNVIERKNSSAIISEFPPGIRCYTWTFIRRNRIISGLSRATVVVKAPLHSGAMITARLAGEQGRDVFACGGFPYTEGYEGCQKLIRDGATIISGAEEVIALYGLGKKPAIEWSPPLFCSDPTGEKIVTFLNKGITDIDTIIRGLSVPASEIRRSLMLLELEGFVRVEGGSVFHARGRGRGGR
ncbi:MAG TPA: DNA-processing protein DprA [Spirochaetota bacterium]